MNIKVVPEIGMDSWHSVVGVKTQHVPYAGESSSSMKMGVSWDDWNPQETPSTYILE